MRSPSRDLYPREPKATRGGQVSAVRAIEGVSSKDYQKHTCFIVIGALDFPRMREFQEYTRAPRATRRWLLLWSLPLGLVAATLMLGLGLGWGRCPPR